jgi:hypothetical protein
MTAKEFMQAVTHGEDDILQALLDILEQTTVSYCVIGGLAVNAYVEPVVSLDLDIVVVAADVEQVCELAQSRGLKVEEFEHSINLGSSRSELRIQLQTDPRYQAFIPRAVKKTVLGYDMQVARLEDVLQGKTWASMDEKRRKSKRQKDLADIARIIEARPELAATVPEELRKLVE